MRSRNGGIDRIPLPDDVPGALWLCGKHHIADDVDAVVERTGRDHRGLPHAPRGTDGALPAVRRRGSTSGQSGRPDDARHCGAIWFPIHDLSAPDLDVYRPFLDDLAWRLRHGEVLVVHCAAGIGRAGTTAVALLLLLGVDVEAALTTVRSHRPMAGPEVGSQLDLITELALTL